MLLQKRLLTELRELREDPTNFCLEPEEGNPLRLQGYLRGPAATPYEGGCFRVALTLPPAYPLVPPTVRFLTPIFHPNINFRTGEVCLDILQSAWSPAWSLASCLRAIQLLLSEPEPSSPLNCDAGNLLRCGDKRGFWSMARMYTLLLATSNE
ncbi:similar to ubiquitin conjugating enzyme E2 [Cyanidioschyzon merolae strain 10D]|jgi:peroxin-4|uniref:Similar to ubiquitin conjugating enzyme E2 n=1 Tax=Cyanidioschyzon merolae (strain NIES-3377 / 10D) TaxID=280699 RepID=M1VG06_CYAM1|nr:similar to ubiquitin conjugating enzyme E2 [Cyanidioschyzon merolae strain 10D]BAM79538.1 similar to ubiquitin conjugating enzyme E2 [Cyanidioschyzon merolae strain 10D]|eukprot:XP_005535824.1 similar to ubiquitin conjugating enzyme E2 [Cyanidioschyzon merolae strain 10D]